MVNSHLLYQLSYHALMFGGDGGSRTRVLNVSNVKSFTRIVELPTFQRPPVIDRVTYFSLSVKLKMQLLLTRLLPPRLTRYAAKARGATLSLAFLVSDIFTVPAHTVLHLILSTPSRNLFVPMFLKIQA